MTTLIIKTDKKKQILDITSQIERVAPNATGICHVFVVHTTVALTTADLDPGTDLDMLDAFEVMMPKLNYRHPHDPAHVTDHILASLIGPSVTLPIENGKLQLGTWQRIVLVELDGPRERTLNIIYLQAS